MHVELVAASIQSSLIAHRAAILNHIRNAVYPASVSTTIPNDGECVYTIWILNEAYDVKVVKR